MTSEPILLVEDDIDLAEEIVQSFGELAHHVIHVVDGNEGLQQGLSGIYSVVILDIELPGKNGFDICRELRKREPLLPILMLTTRTDETDRVLGFELGADDYLTKPFSMKELLARVRSKISRQAKIRELFEAKFQTAEKRVIRIGELSLDLERRKLCKNDVQIDTSAKEFDLLFLLMSNPGRRFSREELLHEVWGVRSLGYEEAVISLVYRLRTKIEADTSKPRYLLTARGFGYAFAEPGQLE